MSRKSIPNGDFEFLIKAECMARGLTEDPSRYGLMTDDASGLSEAAGVFRQALQVCRSKERSRAATVAKEEARRVVEERYRRVRNLVRMNPRVDTASKVALGIQPPAKRTGAVGCPIEPPRLRFVRAIHEGNATPVHELEFRDISFAKARPEGAVRLELFVDLIPPDEEAPAHPGANHGSRPWYRRSYTRSPIKLVPPIARVPMRLLYWGRWADAGGAVGPFSATAAGWIEGGAHAHLPGSIATKFRWMGNEGEQPRLLEVSEPHPQRQMIYRVALLEAQFQSMLPQAVDSPAQLPSPGDGQERAA